MFIRFARRYSGGPEDGEDDEKEVDEKVVAAEIGDVDRTVTATIDLTEFEVEMEEGKREVSVTAPSKVGTGGSNLAQVSL